MLGHWRRIAALLVLAGGFLDASLAHPDRLDALDLLLFASGFASVLLFLSLGAVTRPRLARLALVAVVSVVSAVLDVARGVTRLEVVIAVADVLARLAIVACASVLAYRHLGAQA